MKKKMKKINVYEFIWVLLEKKIIMKNEKKNGAGTEMGYCPNCIAIQFIVLQERGLFGWYCIVIEVGWLGINCIAIHYRVL